MLDQRRADRFASARQVIQHARRQAKLLKNIQQPGRDDRRLFGRLHDDRIARDQGGRRHAGENGERKIPRRDDDRHATRQMHESILFAGHVAAALGLHGHGLLGVELAEVDRFADVAVGLAPSLAASVNFPGGQLEAALAHYFGRAPQESGALFDRPGAPGRLRRRAPRPRPDRPRHAPRRPRCRRPALCPTDRSIGVARSSRRADRRSTRDEIDQRPNERGPAPLASRGGSLPSRNQSAARCGMGCWSRPAKSRRAFSWQALRPTIATRARHPAGSSVRSPARCVRQSSP